MKSCTTARCNELHMSLGEKAWLSIGALVLTVLSILFQLYLERQRQKERERDRNDRKSERQREVEIDYANMDGASMFTSLYVYKNRFQGLPGAHMSYEEDFYANHPPNIDEARSILKKFWKCTIRLYEADLLPDQFLGAGDWLQYGHNYRIVAEPIDISNYNRLSGVWAESGHYLAENNRPHPYRVLQSRWREVYGEAVDSVAFAREMQRRVDPTQQA